MIENQLTIESRIEYYNINIEYLKKIGKVKKNSVCLQKKESSKVIINMDTKEIYYGVAKRLGVADEYKTTLNIKTGDSEHESSFGEVYMLYFPPKKSEETNSKKEEEKKYIAGKIIPLTDYDYKHKLNYSKSDAWKELYIQKFLSKEIVLKKLNPHFSIFYGYFNCESGSIEDYSNKNVLKKMMMHDVLEKLRTEYKLMLNIIDKYNFPHGREKNAMNKFRARIKQIGDEIKKYDIEMDYPNQKYNIISLIELENTSLSSFIENNIYKVEEIIDYAKKFDSNLIKMDIARIEQSIEAQKTFEQKNLTATLPSYLYAIVMYSIIFQCIFAIISMNKQGVIHLDLHTGNILMAYTAKINNNIMDLKSINYWSYRHGGKKIYIPNVGVVCKIADFGFSETLEHFKNKTPAQKGEIGEYVVDKLSYFVFTTREQRDVYKISNSIINSFKYANPEAIFSNMKLFDIVILLIAIIADIDYKKKKMLKVIDEEIKSKKILENYRFELDRMELRETINEIFSPHYRNNLVNIYNYAFSSFINLFRGRKMKRLQDAEFDEIIRGIFTIFKETNLDTKGIDIINKEPYVV